MLSFVFTIPKPFFTTLIFQFSIVCNGYMAFEICQISKVCWAFITIEPFYSISMDVCNMWFLVAFIWKRFWAILASGLDFVVQPFKVSLEFCNCSESFITNITRNCSHQYVTELIMKIVVCVISKNLTTNIALDIFIFCMNVLD